MSLFDNFPYTNFQDTNLDYIFRKLKEIDERYKNIDDVVENIIDQKIADGSLSSAISEEQMQEINAKFDNVDGKIGAANRNIVAANAKINVLEADDAILISDSYGLTPSEDANWMQYLKAYQPGRTYYTSAANGSGFIGAGDGRLTFQQLLTNVSVPDVNKIKYVIVVGGYNDASYLYNEDNSPTAVAALRTAVKNFMQYAQTRFPKAKIMVGMAGACKPTVADNKRRMSLRAATFAYNYTLQKSASIPNINYVLSAPFIDDTLYHPTDVGGQLLAQCVGAAMQGGEYTVAGVSVYKTTITPTNAAIQSITDLNICQDNDKILMYSDASFVITLKSNLQLQHATTLAIGKINNMLGANLEATQLAFARIDNDNSKILPFLVGSSVGNFTIRPLFGNMTATQNIAFYELQLVFPFISTL